MSTHVTQIVRRFGPVGGMERYVWELAMHLPSLNWNVTILCERSFATHLPDDVTIVELGEVHPKPRWLAHLRFSARVARWLKDKPQPGAIIHSHERTGIHHVTTFHGPPFASVRDKPWWQRISPRVQANLWLEQREVCASQVRAVVPNASTIAAMLHRYYPCIGGRMHKPITPGVGPGPVRPERTVPANGGVIGFIGTEWKRKGLDTAIEIVNTLRKQRPGVELWVAGPKPEEIQHLFTGWRDGYRLLGAVDSRELYPEFDLLLHPARAEPYGMVITEAMTAKVPVLVSENCGAASEIGQAHGDVVAINAPVNRWAEAADRLLSRKEPPPGFERSWNQVAQEYVTLYASIKP